MGKISGSKKSFSLWISKKNKVHVEKIHVSNKAVTLQDSLRPILIIGQAFGLFPVIGLYSKQEANLRFYWISWKCLYSIVLLTGQIWMCIMCFNQMFRMETTLQSTSPAIFYGTTCISIATFLQVSLNWPELIKHAIQIEDLDPNFDTTLTSKCYITCAIVLVLAIIEHILSLLYALSEAIACYSHTHASTYEGFVRVSYPWMYNCMPYSTLLGIITQFLHFQATFIWNFSDLFVICTSYYLTSCLNNVNQKLLIAQGKYLPASFWRSAREEYSRVTQLVRKVDNVISGIVFISFANNLFFVCLQLFNTLENGIKGTGACRASRLTGTTLFAGYEGPAYFIFSLVYLISRSVAVSLIASQVNSASLLPAPVLYDVPSPVYCIEVQRFIDQVHGDNVALSGLQFFSVTRELLLTVAGTIVTYELVMLQLTPSESTANRTLT
ncbi:gustatory receptor for sugar taste 64f-like [Leguminivora glycinivorella]|uniref:gustatory receptor for sugar taste 64f-like n=1 Tax=Leguminivora glycinivorella TaxID=1035111 RepID=UPI00200E8A56|nr:gustatory receptor for sugar taste 64f-like [Leguminivora glycinivorella]